MTILSLIFMIIVHAIPWIFPIEKKLALDPTKLIAVISFIMTVPYFSIISTYPEIVGGGLTIREDPRVLVYTFGMYYSLGMLSTYIVVWVFPRPRKIDPLGIGFIGNNLHYNLRLTYITYSLCVIFILMKLYSVGGIFYIINNIGLRSQIQSGTFIYDLIITPSSYLFVFFAFHSIKMSNQLSIDQMPSRISLSFMIVSVFMLLILFGGRKAPMMFAIFSLLSASVYLPKFSLASPKAIFTYSATAILFVLMLEYRISSQSHQSNSIELIDFIRNIGYVDTYIFILDHFNYDRLWYGQLFLDLVQRIIPIYGSNISPPVDDGVYIRTLAEGIYVRPPVSYEFLYKSSWPLETFGSGYANFGFFGIVLFSLLKGLASAIAFFYARKNNFRPIPLFIMIYISVTFHLSNLRIVQTIILGLGIIILALIGYFYAASKQKSKVHFT